MYIQITFCGADTVLGNIRYLIFLLVHLTTSMTRLMDKYFQNEFQT